MTEIKLIEVRKVTKLFGGVTAVDNMNITIYPAETLALIGPNGAGKTTLFNIISGIERCDVGDVYFEGNNVTHMPSWKMANLGVGRTFQNIRLFSDLSVMENICLAKKGIGVHRLQLAEVKPLLEKMDLVEYANKRAGSLPYGVRRRIELARALACNPKVILLDEPTAGMNPVEVNELMEVIEELTQEGIAILLIEHNMRVAMGIADRVVVMNLGSKISEGTPGQVQANKEVIEAYLGEGVRG